MVKYVGGMVHGMLCACLMNATVATWRFLLTQLAYIDYGRCRFSNSASNDVSFNTLCLLHLASYLKGSQESLKIGHCSSSVFSGTLARCDLVSGKAGRVRNKILSGKMFIVNFKPGMTSVFTSLVVVQ